MRMRSLAAFVAFLAGSVGAAQAHSVPFAGPILDASGIVGGTDAAGGIGDVHLSNGVIEAVIDGVGRQDDLPAGVDLPIQNSVAPTGGTLVDLARVGFDNDQFAQTIQVIGLDGSQVPRYTSVTSELVDGAAIARAVGTVPFDPDTASSPLFPRGELAVVTEYRAEPGSKALVMRTTLTNPAGSPPIPILNFFDAFIWAGKGPLPFTPQPGKGFHHHLLPDLAQPQRLVPALEIAPYVVGMGLVDEVRDGGASDGRPVGGVCYGIVSGGATIDADGDGPLPPAPAVGPPLVVGLSNTLASAVGFGGPNVIPPGGSFTYTRYIYVGTQSDVASCTELVFEHFGVQPFPVEGHVADIGGGPIEASLEIRADSPPPIPGLVAGVPLTQTRSDRQGNFRVALPVGIYRARVTASERTPVDGTIVVLPGGASKVALPAMEKTALITVSGTVNGAPGPMQYRFIRTDGPQPRLGKLFDVITFDTSRPGACAASPDLTCSADADCAAVGGSCLRVCSIDPGRTCSADVDCLPGQCIAGVDEKPESLGGGLAQGSTLYTLDGNGSVDLRPGTYRVIASRGLEYEIDEKTATITADPLMPASLSFALTKAFDTSGAISADFHIHSARSFDSSAPLFDRVASFAAAGVEVMVATDHDFHTNYAPVIEALGLGRWITSIVGNEVTTGSPPTVGNELKFGHLNGFPVPFLPTARRRGSIEDEFVNPSWIYERLRGQGAQVVQINHPRAPLQGGNTGIGWFNNAGFDPARPIEDTDGKIGSDPGNADPNDFLLDVRVAPHFDAVHATRNIDFDTLEVANAARPADVLAWRSVRRDWTSLLLQGFFKPATGVSDSHRITVETPGYARTFVLGAGDDPATFDPAPFYRSIRAGHMVVTTGPMIRFTASAGSATAGIGDALASPTGDVTLSIEVDAARWVPIEEVRVLANGRVVQAIDVSAETGTVRLDVDLARHLDRDAFLVVEAGPRLPADPDSLVSPSPGYSDVVPSAIAFAFTNPIFVDVGADGYTPPGLPACTAGETSIICEGAIALRPDNSHMADDVSFLIRLPAAVAAALAR